MKKMMRSAIIIFASATLLAGCGSDDTELQEEVAEGQEADEQATVLTGASVPVDLPDGFTLYPGATIISNTVVGQGDDKGTILMMESEASAQEMVDFYRDKATAANIGISMDVATKTGKIIGGERADGLTFSFSAQESRDQTLGQLSIGKSVPANETHGDSTPEAGKE